VKSSKAEIFSRVYDIPDIQFEAQRLTSYSGMVIFQALFQGLRLKERLRGCFSHLRASPIYGHHVVTLLLVVHLILGFRRLRDRDYYSDDPLVQRILGLRQIPYVSTISRVLRSADFESVQKLREFSSSLVIDRLVEESLRRVTLDFDGSVFSTKRHAEETAVGYNKKKKGERSYYPLFCTVAQTGQILDVYHRAGNVHDSRGSIPFMENCLNLMRKGIPHCLLESRVDSAFFNDDFIDVLDANNVEFTASVPFERLAELKEMVESRQRWILIDDTWAYFEAEWKPKSWECKYRFIFVRQKTKVQDKEPIQLDLFAPKHFIKEKEELFCYDYRVIVTNKTVSAKKVIEFHHGRGTQEKIIGEAKTSSNIDYIPMNRWIPNQIYCLAAILAHNLTRELIMTTSPPSRGTTETRKPLWIFETLATIRQTLIHRAGRITRPQGKLMLTMNANERVRKEFTSFLKAVA